MGLIRSGGGGDKPITRERVMGVYRRDLVIKELHSSLFIADLLPMQTHRLPVVGSGSKYLEGLGWTCRRPQTPKYPQIW